MSFERGIRRAGEDDAGEPLGKFDLSAEVADANLAKDLAEQMYREACERHQVVMPLEMHTTIGVLVLAMKLFVERQEGIYPQPELDRRPPCILFKRRP